MFCVKASTDSDDKKLRKDLEGKEKVLIFALTFGESH